LSEDKTLEKSTTQILALIRENLSLSKENARLQEAAGRIKIYKSKLTF
jgi:hypothetical protein